jgi:20S proteasome alpha/beta subunit
LPDTADPAGSAVDAQILARYVWLAASRYEEYKDALCLCVADAIPAIYAIAPAEHNLFKEQEPMTVERVRQIAREWMS